ncbi:MAG: hypothetical protein ACPGUZ_00445 [Holosporaceae bacterium]
MKFVLSCAAAFALFYASSLSAANGDTQQATPSEQARHRPVVTRPAKARPAHPPSLDKTTIAIIQRTLPGPLKSRLALLPFSFDVLFSHDLDDQQLVSQALAKDAQVRVLYDDLKHYLSDNQDQILKEVRRHLLRQQLLYPNPVAHMKASAQKAVQGVQKAKTAAMRARANVQGAIDRANRHRMPRTQRPVAKAKALRKPAKPQAKRTKKPAKPQAKRTKKPATPLYTKAKEWHSMKDRLDTPPEVQLLMDFPPPMF